MPVVGSTPDYPRLVRDAVRAIGYTDPHLVFNINNLDITPLLTQLATEIGMAVSKGTDTKTGAQTTRPGAKPPASKWWRNHQATR